MKKFHVFKCWLFSLRAGGLSCSLGVLHRGLGINVQCCHFLSEKLKNYFQLVKFYNFLSLNPWIRVQNWIRSRIETNADPQHRLRYRDDFNCGSYSNFPSSLYFLSCPYTFQSFHPVFLVYTTFVADSKIRGSDFYYDAATYR